MGNSAQVARTKRDRELAVRELHDATLTALRCQPTPGCRSSLSPMLRALSADAWAQHHLTHFLGLADLAALHSACKSWFQWLEAPNARLVSTAPRRGQFTVAALQAFAQVRWIKPFATELFICVSAVAVPVKGQRFSPFTRLISNARHDFIAWNQLLRALPAFSQLSVLHLHYDESSDVELFSLAVDRCFTALSLSLRELSLTCPGIFGFSGEPTRSLMRNIATLSRLEVLNVFVDGHAGVYSAIPYFSFQSQPMTMLHTLRFNPRWFRPMTSSLGADLATMLPALTDLGWGSWDPVSRPFIDEEVRDHEARVIAQGIAVFVAKRMEAQQAGTAVPLLKLDLTTTTVSSGLWREISLLSSLTELHPECWNLSESEDEWLKLGNFASLTSLSLVPAHRSEPNAKHQLHGCFHGVAQCASLTSLSCTSVIVSVTDLALIVRRCTRLAALTLIEAQLESMASLRDAEALTALELRHCTGEAASVRSQLPTMVNLRRLVIHETAATLSRSERKLLNDALLSRMPALAAGFVQCLEPAPTHQDEA